MMWYVADMLPDFLGMHIYKLNPSSGLHNKEQCTSHLLNSKRIQINPILVIVCRMQPYNTPHISACLEEIVVLTVKLAVLL